MELNNGVNTKLGRLANNVRSLLCVSLLACYSINLAKMSKKRGNFCFTNYYLFWVKNSFTARITFSTFFLRITYLQVKIIFDLHSCFLKINWTKKPL